MLRLKNGLRLICLGSSSPNAYVEYFNLHSWKIFALLQLNMAVFFFFFKAGSKLLRN